MKLKALEYMRYARKAVQPGDIFEANAADVRVLLALKRAEHYVEPPNARAFKPTPAVVPMEQETKALVAEVNEDTPKRAYKRRDLTAE